MEGKKMQRFKKKQQQLISVDKASGSYRGLALAQGPRQV